MKQLFWKECYELRFLPLGAALAVAVLLAGIKAYTHWSHEPYPVAPFLLSVLVAVWLVFAALAGAGTISQEIGTGTLQFLSSLPVYRRTLWWVKVGAALGIQIPAFLTSTIVWLFFCYIWCSDRFIIGISGVANVLAFTFPILLCVLAIALAVSPFFDRSLSAFFASLLVVCGVGGLFISLASRMNNTSHPEYLIYMLVGLSIPAFAAISYWTFTRGETLRSRKRFIVAGITGGVCVGISLVILATASAFGAW